MRLDKYYRLKNNKAKAATTGKGPSLFKTPEEYIEFKTEESKNQPEKIVDGEKLYAVGEWAMVVLVKANGKIDRARLCFHQLWNQDRKGYRLFNKANFSDKQAVKAVTFFLVWLDSLGKTEELLTIMENLTEILEIKWEK